MKKSLALFLSLFLYVSSGTSFANTNTVNSIPDELYIKEHWLSLTTSYDIETKTQKLGTLYRKFFSLLLTYEFYDPFDNKLAIARSKFFSLTAHFDIYDTSDNLLGAADERFFAFFPTFDIYARDAYTKLATAKMNFWGTTFTIYDPITNKEMATLHRSFFRWKNDWTFTVTDRALFEQKGIEPRVLMTVIAFQSDREYWEANNQYNSLKTNTKSINTDEASDVTPTHVRALLEKVAAVSKQEGLDTVENPDPKSFEAIATELENNYIATENVDDSLQTNQEKISAFTDYCLNLVQSNTLSDTKKKTILYLLKERLEHANN